MDTYSVKNEKKTFLFYFFIHESSVDEFKKKLH